MVRGHTFQVLTCFAATALVMQAVGALCWADPVRDDQTDRTLKRIQQGLDLAQVSRDTLRTVLTSEKVGSTDYLTIASDVVTGVRIAKNVHDGKYVEAVKQAGKCGSKTALSVMGLSGIATVWTAAEPGVDGALYLVAKFDERIIEGITAAYVIRRSRGESDDDAWTGTRDYPPNLIHGWPVASGPFATDDERQRAQQELDARIREQCRSAWQIYRAYLPVEGDRTRLRSEVLDLVATYDVQNASASLRSSSGDATALISRNVTDFSLTFDTNVHRREGGLFFRLSPGPGTGEHGLTVDGRDGYGLIFCPFANQGANPGLYVVVRQAGKERTIAYSGDGFPRRSGRARFTLIVKGDDITVSEGGRALLHARDSTFSSGRLVWRVYGDTTQHARASFRIISYTSDRTYAH